jgi:acyl dehydratase
MCKWNVGDSVTIEKVFETEQVKAFADLVDDHNKVHLDKDFAASTIFKKPIVHGMLTSSLISGLLGEKMPGIGTIYLGQNLSFKLPIFVGEKVTASATITKIKESKAIATLITQVFNSQGQLAVDGEAIVKLPA